MRIIIDYDGSIAKCYLIACTPSAIAEEIERKTYTFSEAPKIAQILALDAFKTIEEFYKRNRLNNE